MHGTSLTRKKRSSRLLGALLLSGIGLLGLKHNATHAFTMEPVIKKGAVMARAVVEDENGQPILVEYNDDGAEVGEVHPVGYQDRIRELTIVSATEYHQQKARLEYWQEQNEGGLADDAEVMSRRDFLEEQYTLSDGQTTIAPPSLREGIHSVLVRGQSQRFLENPQNLVLMTFSIDLSTEPLASVPDSGSLVLSPHGEIIASAEGSIGPRVGFFGDASEAQNGALMGRDPEDDIFGPVSGVEVFVDKMVFPGSVAMTDEEGKYVMTFLTPPCPPWGMTWKTDTFVKLQYKSFSPHGAPYFPYYLRRQDWSTCIGMPQPTNLTLGGLSAYTNAMATWAAQAIPLYDLDFWVDVMFLTGTLRLANPDDTAVPVGGTTQYQVFDTGFHDQPITQNNYDFDGDGQTDQAVLGNLVTQTNDLGETEEVFQPADDPANAEVQGVWLSGNPEPGPQPDIIRQADTANRQQSTGFLSSISAEDLQNTDLMVFREATGELVLERQGLRDQEISGRKQIGEADDGESLFYDLMLRGMDDSSLNIGGTDRRGSWTEWATRNQLAEPFREREANHLKPGEWIRLVAINRPTGYIATQRVQLSSAANNRMSLLNVPVDPLVLRPPNLKIWAERRFDVTHGLTAGDSRNYLIGAEGASLTSDSLIQVYTEWLDHDGRPLPEGLAADDGADFGLTGRLAKVVNNSLEPAGQGPNSDLANFPIAPGLQTQVIQIKDNQAVPEHFYLHVAGTPQNRNPDFGAGGASAAPLDTRPGQLTPFKTPLFDENSDWKSFSAWHKVNEADGNTGDDRTNKPDSVYQWHYRPEYQFSRFELEMKDIERQYTNEAGNTHTLDLLTGQSEDGKVPTLRGDDDLVSILYDLAGASFDRLSPIDGPQDLVFSLGGEEVQVTLGDDQQITFKNLEQINRLHPADLVTMRLYTNQDAGNALWEYAFTRNGLHVYYKIPGNTEENDEGRDDIEIVSLLNSPEQEDDFQTELPPPTIRTLGGMRLRYRYLPPSIDGATIQQVTWRINHRGRYCNGYGVEPDTGCSDAIAAGEPYSTDKEYAPNESDNVYWEPLDENNNVLWSLWAGEKTDSDGVTANLFAEYTLPTQGDSEGVLGRSYEQDFVIKTRELAPVTGDAEPMEGSDVAMLEAMLWAFGLSPQGSSPGSLASRIDSVRYQDKDGNNVVTASCVAGQPHSRDTFLTDVPTDTTCASTQRMVRRFQTRNNNNNHFVSVSEINAQPGAVDEDTLAHLARDWRLYFPVTQEHPTPVLTRHDQSGVPFRQWVTAALDMWQQGSGSTPASYTDDVHQRVLSAADASGVTRTDLLEAWISEESPFHWGTNGARSGGGANQPTPFRMMVGGDEHGSLSFSQLTYPNRFGPAPCEAQAEAKLNPYDPADQIKIFALHTASASGSTGSRRNCPGGFNMAFVTDTLGMAYEQSGANSVADLRGWKTGAGVKTATEEDEYEKLAKGIYVYNAGTWVTTANKLSWPALLKHKKYSESSDKNDQAKNICHSCKYSLQVRAAAFGSDNLRTYIWQGGTYDEDMPLTDEEGNVQTDENDEPILDPRAGEDWCFAYGEKEWMEGSVYNTVREQTERHIYNRDRAGDNNAEVDCP